MIWKYFIPHTWRSDRALWEDVYLLPDDARYEGRALWLTIDAYGDPTDPELSEGRAEFQAYAERQLAGRDFCIEGTDMIVKQCDFTKEELLDWVRVWLRENQLPVTDLQEGTPQEFAGKAWHATLMAGYTADSDLSVEIVAASIV
jgi:hypothetical protein